MRLRMREFWREFKLRYIYIIKNGIKLILVRMKKKPTEIHFLFIYPLYSDLRESYLPLKFYEYLGGQTTKTGRPVENLLLITRSRRKWRSLSTAVFIHVLWTTPYWQPHPASLLQLRVLLFNTGQTKCLQSFWFDFIAVQLFSTGITRYPPPEICGVGSACPEPALGGCGTIGNYRSMYQGFYSLH